MSFLSDTSLLINIEELSLNDYINGSFNINGQYLTLQAEKGLALQLSDTYYDIDALNSISTAFTIGFWLKSNNQGMITNPNTNETQPLKIPLFTKSNQINTGDETQLTDEMFSIWEETQSNGKNKLKIRIIGASTSILTSSEYSVGVFHHFWIVYNGTNLSLYIDGEIDNYIIDGDIPSSLSSSSASFYINKTIDSYNYETSYNNGLLIDLVIFSTEHSNINEIFKCINFGSLSICDETLINEDETTIGFLFDDTSTIQINSIFCNRGNVYIGKSNGKLLKGVRTFWESRRDFSSSDEINYMDIITRSLSDNYSINNGVLNISNGIMRI